MQDEGPRQSIGGPQVPADGNYNPTNMPSSTIGRVIPTSLQSSGTSRNSALRLIVTDTNAPAQTPTRAHSLRATSLRDLEPTKAKKDGSIDEGSLNYGYVLTGPGFPSSGQHMWTPKGRNNNHSHP